jgi:hypothetical protein
MSELAVHPVAALFPMLADDELDELAADIKARGLLQPIVLDAEGRVLDGRNRLAACKKAGIEPDFITYADGDSDGYALAVNINRRHLKPGARHLITEMARRRKEGVAVPLRQVAKANGTDPMRLVEAGLVLDYSIDGDLRDDVLSGGGLEAAADKARERKRIIELVIYSIVAFVWRANQRPPYESENARKETMKGRCWPIQKPGWSKWLKQTSRPLRLFTIRFWPDRLGSVRNRVNRSPLPHSLRRPTCQPVSPAASRD